MKNADTLINALQRAVEMERTLQDYYKHASRHARTVSYANRMEAMEEAHLAIAGRLHRRVEQLERAAGEGLLADLMHSIGDAIHDTIAGLPVGLIRTETNPSPEMLLESERELLNHYEALRPNLDPDTGSLVDHAMDVCRRNIEELTSIDNPI